MKYNFQLCKNLLLILGGSIFGKFLAKWMFPTEEFVDIIYNPALVIITSLLIFEVNLYFACRGLKDIRACTNKYLSWFNYPNIDDGSEFPIDNIINGIMSSDNLTKMLINYTHLNAMSMDKQSTSSSKRTQRKINNISTQFDNQLDTLLDSLESIERKVQNMEKLNILASNILERCQHKEKLIALLEESTGIYEETCDRIILEQSRIIRQALLKIKQVEYNNSILQEALLPKSLEEKPMMFESSISEQTTESETESSSGVSDLSRLSDFNWIPGSSGESESFWSSGESERTLWSSDNLETPESSDNLEIPESSDNLEIPESSDDLEIPESSDNLEIPESSDDLEIPESSDNLETPENLEEPSWIKYEKIY